LNVIHNTLNLRDTEVSDYNNNKSDEFIYDILSRFSGFRIDFDE